MNAVWDEYHQIVFRRKHRANFLRKVRYDTLSNVETRRGEANPPSVRLAPDTIPEAKSSSTGVSVRYVPDKNRSWYVFRASYEREDKASGYIVVDGTFVYIAQRRRKSCQSLRPL